MSRFKEYLEYYKRKLERNIKDESTVHYVIDKLIKTEFPASDLLNTGIYKSVRAISKSAGQFADKALPLYNKWKLLILAEQNEQMKPLPAQPNIPAPNRAIETSENHVTDSSKIFPPQPLDMKNGFNDILQKNPFGFPDNDLITKPPYNPSPVNDAGYKNKSSMPGQVNRFQPLNNPADAGFKAKGSISVQSSGSSFQPFNNSHEAGFKAKSSIPIQPPVVSNTFQPFSNFSNSNDAAVKTISSIPAPPSIVNTSDHFSNFGSSSQPVQNVNLKVPEILIDQNSVSDFSANFDSHSNMSTAFSSPRSTCSQNPLDIGAPGTTSPNKIGRIPDPYTIEMREGMFRVVKSREGLTPEIIRVRRLYSQEDENYDSDTPNDEGKVKEKLKTPKKSEQLPKNGKSSKVVNDKSAEKTLNSKSKNHNTPDKANRVEKSKSGSSSDKSAIIEKSKKSKEGQSEVSKYEKNCSPHKSSSKSNSKGSPLIKSSAKESPLVKSSTKGSPSVKSNTKVSPSVKSSSKGSPSVKSSSKGSPSVKSSSKGSPSVKSSSKGSPPVKSNSKGSPSVKSNIKGSPSVKSNTKGSPSVKSNTKGSPSVKSNSKRSPSVISNHSSPCDIKKNSGHKPDCDKKSSKVLPTDASESFISSKKERTSVYSGKKTLQEVPSLQTCCVRLLQKNIECIKYTRSVPYEQLKPILTQCSPNQLRKLEEYNPYLMRGTEEIWKILCQRKYRDVRPHSNGTWRDLYWKAREDQDKKLKNITATISASRQRAAPERQMMLTESPERPRSKKMRLSAPDPKEAAVKIAPKEPAQNSFKESNTLSHKVPPKEPSHPKPSVKESNLLSHHKKVKKAPVAPLMSKVKKTISFFARHKK